MQVKRHLSHTLLFPNRCTHNVFMERYDTDRIWRVLVVSVGNKFISELPSGNYIKKNLTCDTETGSEEL